MTNLPVALRSAVETALGAPLNQARPVGGGDINQAAYLETAEGRYFLKWNAKAPPKMFSAEQDGLKRLAEAGALKTPSVIAQREAENGAPAFLLLEWLDAQAPRDPNKLAERLGEGLAALHRHSALEHGLARNNFIGSLTQRNKPNESWVAFYRDQRLGAQIEIARQNGRLTIERERLLFNLCNRLHKLIPEATPALLHGDLWSGNYMSLTDDTPAIYDPAVYYGHREVELAFTELFGGFAPRFYAAYNAAFPLDPGYAQRKALYQLYPLLVHMNLFGGAYTASVERIAKQYLR